MPKKGNRAEGYVCSYVCSPQRRQRVPTSTPPPAPTSTGDAQAARYEAKCLLPLISLPGCPSGGLDCPQGEPFQVYCACWAGPVQDLGLEIRGFRDEGMDRDQRHAGELLAVRPLMPLMGILVCAHMLGRTPY
jgi:hypothetical protein